MTNRLIRVAIAAIALAPVCALAQEAGTKAAPSPTAGPTAGAAHQGNEQGPAVSSSPGGGPGGRPADGATSGGGQQMWMLLGLVVLMILMFYWTGRSRRKQEAKRKELLASLKKGDKITTIGGIIGTVIEVRENEVTIKTDETNNVRMKFARWAVREVGEPPRGDVPPDDRK
ncbi:MAG: preprotein translocase subunit YajC [Phycisphaerae bacterium]